MLSKDQTISLLNEDFIRNYCIIELLQGSTHHDIFIKNQSVLIRLKDEGDSFTMLSFSDTDDGLELLKHLSENDRYLYNVGDLLREPVLRGLKVKHLAECQQVYLPEDVQISTDWIGLIPLNPELSYAIHSQYEYKHLVSREYLEKRIICGPALGIEENTQLAGWIMVHEEGTIGALQVVPEYRKRGFATRLIAAMVTKLREANKPCLAHIVNDNAASLSAFYKAGFINSCQVQWIILDKNDK